MSRLVDYVPRPAEWTLDALCIEVGDPDLWFPEKGGSTRDALGICRRCPVAAECLEFSLERPERFGVWGGLSERKRRPLAGDTWDADQPDLGETA